MRLFVLKDSTDSDGAVLAVLCYYEGADEFYIDMPQGADPWTVPFVLSSFASRGRWSVGPEWSWRWVESRLVPRSRQNLGEILRVNKLADYDALRLIQMTEGRNSQDDCYLEAVRLDDCPQWFLEREQERVVEAIPLERRRLLVAFRSGGTRVYDTEDFLALDNTPGDALARVVADDAAFEHVAVAPGGRGVRWGHAIEVPDADLASAGTPLPLSWSDLARIAPTLLLDASEAAEALGCTRQNLHALAKRGSLRSVKSSGKITLYLRADVQSRASGAETPTHYTHISL